MTNCSRPPTWRDAFYLGIAFGTREARRKVDSEAEQVALAAAQVAFRLRKGSKSS